METLIKELKKYKRNLSNEYKQNVEDNILEKLVSVYPFNKFEYIISHLIANAIISLDEYLDIRARYMERNKFLYLFELAPRTFGETWGQRHLIEHIPDFKIPTRQIDPSYQGEYDLLLNDIHVAVKASLL